jgi:hypothetical protein
MSKEALNKPNPVERRIVIVGGASEVLDDALKEFIVEWLVPTLVEEYIRINSKGPMHGDTRGIDPNEQEFNLNAGS